jgi:MFS superfamily sulfate permease-like transporter
MPEELFKKIKSSIPRQFKICFVSALLVGLVAHIYKLTNWLPNWDSLVFRYDPQNMIALGRWFLPVVCAPSSFYDLPWLVGLLALVFHGLGAVCICRMFRVSKSTTAALIGAAVITFPTVTSVLTYNYVAEGYAIAFLLSSLAATLLVEEKRFNKV